MTLIEAEDIVADTLSRSHRGFQISTKKYFQASEIIRLHKESNAADIREQQESLPVDEIEHFLDATAELESQLLNEMEGDSVANT